MSAVSVAVADNTFENTLRDEAYVLKDQTLLPVGWSNESRASHLYR